MPTEVPRDVLPPAERAFEGKVGTYYSDSVADVPVLPSAPDGAPNVLVVLLDDVGFGASSTFGGPIPTPALDRVANAGLRYSQFHTTALCSPTRAALLTGRNHHSGHMGAICEIAYGFPGYDGVIPQSAATIAQILRMNGYSTALFGKAHFTPMWEVSPAGPFDRWPTGLGFSLKTGPAPVRDRWSVKDIGAHTVPPPAAFTLVGRSACRYPKSKTEGPVVAGSNPVSPLPRYQPKWPPETPSGAIL